MSCMGEKEAGFKLINDALKMNFKNSVTWHFLALYHKNDKNYKQTVSSYTFAMKYDPDNFNVMRDMSFLQLQLRQLNSFADSSNKLLNLRPTFIPCWAQTSMAYFLVNSF